MSKGECSPSYNMGSSKQLNVWKEKDSSNQIEMAAGLDFDWYQATVMAKGDETAIRSGKRVIEILEKELKPSAIRYYDRGMHGYTRRCEFLDPRGGVELTILYGGNPHPNIRATGYRAAPFAIICREIFPEHRVTRLDVAIDYCQPNAWTEGLKACKVTMRRANMDSGLLMLPDKESKGATYYMGSRNSPVLARLYQKGLQMAGKNEDKEYPADWVRLELQVRPAKEAKSTFAKLTPEECWGASKWSQDLYHRVSDRLVPRRAVDEREPSEWERTQNHLMGQYARHMFKGGQIVSRLMVGDETWQTGVRSYFSAMAEQVIEYAEEKICSGEWEKDERDCNDINFPV